VAFQRSYMTRMGLDSVGAPQGVIYERVMMLFDRYQFSFVLTQTHTTKDTVKEMAAKLASLKGYPLRVTFRLVEGGDDCPMTQSDSDGTENNPVSKMLGGLFAKKSTPGAPDTGHEAQAANAPPPLPGGYKQIVAFSVETTAVSTDAISPDQFELPVGWVRRQKPPVRSMGLLGDAGCRRGRT
jgi:hypothetical protein